VALVLGTRLGPYEILSAIGAGGMGEVYRAHDTKLNRDVALKILAGAFAHDGDRIARFRREAQVLASLNHPNIAAIYGFEDSGSTHALVLELVDGPTLADRIAKGPIPLDEALPIARQIAEALEVAHEQGIIHRDLKPANIKLRADGTVKVLDFGLAKLADPPGTGVAPLSESPTITTPAQMTGIGALLGTAAYMSPEQAKGRPADKRSDVWAFGCVLYEMLTGRRAFEGDAVSETLAAVLRGEPDWGALPPDLPPALRTVIRRAVQKDPKRRLPDIGITRLEIDETLAPSSELSPSSVIVGARSRTGWRAALPWLLAAALGAALAIALWAPWRKPPVPLPVRLSAEVGADVTIGVPGAPGANLALSPDGKLLVFAAQRTTGVSELYIRRVDQLQATAMSGTDDGRNPFFSPDGQWIGFFAGDKLKKVSIAGGAPVTLCDAAAGRGATLGESGRGATWGDNGTIVFQPLGAPGASLQRVSDGGGKPEPFTTLANGESSQRWPQLLPGGKAVLFTTGTPGSFDDGNIVVQPLPDGPHNIVQRGGYYGRVVPSGHLLYIHSGTLFAAPFDLDRLAIAGRSVPVLVGINTFSGTGAANFAVSDIGTLVYLAGQGVGNEVPMVWLDRTGKTVPLRTTPADWRGPRVSPDGTRLAMAIRGGGGGLPEVWVYDWMRDTPTQFTFGANPNVAPVWTPDGRRIAFASGSIGATNLYWQRADGTGDAQRLTESTRDQLPGSWHPNGKVLAFTEANPQTGYDIKILTVEGDEAQGWKPGTPTVFLNGTSDEQDPQFSPDGRWIAYFSNQSGQPEVYVRPYPISVGMWQISTGGGVYPIWSRTRSELFYITPNQQIMVASYTAAGGSFTANKAEAWWSGRILPRPRDQPYALHPDGNRFAVSIASDATTKQDHIVFVSNFFDELRRLAPAVK
jgi:serine/threonine-protein kinase